jgi:DNA-binding response OmpR family regulator
MKVLIIAHEGPLRNSLRIHLANLAPGSDIETAESFSYVFQNLERRAWDLIMLDSDMGFERLLTAVKSIKWQRPASHCAVFIDKEEDRQPALQAGADNVLTKSFTSAQLFQMITRALLMRPSASKGAEGK